MRWLRIAKLAFGEGYSAKVVRLFGVGSRVTGCGVMGRGFGRNFRTMYSVLIVLQGKGLRVVQLWSLRLHNDVQNIHEELAVYINTLSWDYPTIYYNDDDDEDCTIAITPKEPDKSLNMGDEHLDTIPATKSDEFINSSFENLVPNPKIISIKIDPHHFNAESDLIESLLNDDSLIILPVIMGLGYV
nr:hypothetical protein [Tanacetum cinerariifolium]